MFAPVLAIARGVPVWVWALVACLTWGGIQHYRARAAGHELLQAQTAAAADEAQALRASIAESTRRAAAHQEIASAAQAQADAHARAAAAARATADRVRSAAAAYAASAAARGAAPAGDCKATEAVAGVLAELLGRTADRAAELADLADRAQGAGRACEAAYDALRPAP